MTRADGRLASELRAVTIERGWSDQAEGSALISFGNTKVLCTASFTPGVPRWLSGQGRGWVTAEYGMLPRSTNDRMDRESVKGKIGGRTHEISRLIGRSLRGIIDLKQLGRTLSSWTVMSFRQTGNTHRGHHGCLRGSRGRHQLGQGQRPRLLQKPPPCAIQSPR